MLTGWINRHRQQDMTSLQEANRLLKVQRVGCRRPLADTARRRLTAWPYLLSCTLGTDVASIARSDSLMQCLTVSRPDGAPALLPERCRQTAACPWGQCAGKPAPPPAAFSHRQALHLPGWQTQPRSSRCRAGVGYRCGRTLCPFPAGTASLRRGFSAAAPRSLPHTARESVRRVGRIGAAPHRLV